MENFANIAGKELITIIATKMGLSLADFVVTEAGFWSRFGSRKIHAYQRILWKFKNQMLYVLVATVSELLRYHGGAKKANMKTESRSSRKGIENLKKHIENGF